MRKNVMIWVAHPREGSFCEGLANSYREGAESSGADVRMIRLSDMEFDANLHPESGHELEDDLLYWQESLTWANHILIVHPYWWAGMPGRAKVLLDRVLTPGFAFKYKATEGVAWDKLLTGRTADGIITSDTPPWIDTLFFNQTGRKVLKGRILGFCGIKAKKVVQFGSIKTSTAEKREKWLKYAQKMGAESIR